jgi:hypothetical protein
MLNRHPPCLTGISFIARTIDSGHLYLSKASKARCHLLATKKKYHWKAFPEEGREIRRWNCNKIYSKQIVLSKSDIMRHSRPRGILVITPDL